MNEQFSTINDLRMAFVRRQFVPQQKINVEGINYHFQKSNNPPLDKVINEGWNMFMLYVIDAQRANQLYYDFAMSRKQNPTTTADQPGTMLAFMWKWNPNINVIMPVNVRPTMPQRLGALELDKDWVNEQQQPIGLTTEVMFIQLGKVLTAKVDTGATTSSVHAEDWKISDDRVLFRSSVFGGTLTVPLVGTHDVHTSDGGVERRPIIAMDIKVNGQVIKSVHFNLNDRANMDYPVLLGQNALQQGQFVVDPSEGVDWDYLNKLFENDTFQDFPLTISADYDKVKDAIITLETNDVSLKDMIRFIRTHALESLEV
jgi:ribosomal protein S6--L-glutamate ligase